MSPVLGKCYLMRNTPTTYSPITKQTHYIVFIPLVITHSNTCKMSERTQAKRFIKQQIVLKRSFSIFVSRSWDDSHEYCALRKISVLKSVLFDVSCEL